MRALRTRSKLTCPHCAFAESLEMPVSSCVIVHTCSGCGAELRPKSGDCCVFCSYGSVACPPIQSGFCTSSSSFDEETQSRRRDAEDAG